MFANALRSQARLGLRTAVRLPATRTLSALAGTRVAAAAVATTAAATPSSLARLVVVSSRAFSQSAAVLNESQQHFGESDTIFVGNLPWSATRDEIQEMFSEFGQVVNVRIQTHADGRPRGFAHVTFANVKDSVAAVVSATEEPMHLGGRDLNVNYARPKQEAARNNPPSEKVYFSGCAEGESALREILKNVEGDIVDVHFLRDGNTGETLPTGFVEFRSVDIATDAIKQFDGTEMEGGTKLFLTYARPRRARTEGGGSRFGGDRNSRNREPYRTRSYRPQKDY
ncbi:hypothetical protein M413DRAFT_445198 [Hebeloma cylindrosporum]|uniref:RRM domain-containing protein n=1 Tax=Hebeloma cylindrosporum TaxID=76867 RepID=A0A0C3BZI6_HEBCY|nr:hypothetical protein M413DRAFT_445198 [Hebeloma cylindrosporum h7]